MAVIAGPIAAIPLFFLLGLEGRSLGWRAAIARFGRWLLWLVPGAILAYAVMAVIWPWSVLAPLNPLRAVEYFAHFFEKPWRELFNGVPVLVPDMPWSYLPTLLALKLPEIFTALALVGTAVAILGACRKEASPQRRAVLLVVVCAAFVPIAITLVTRPALYNGVRHFVFVLPPMAVLGGLAADRLLHWCSQRHRALQGALLAVLLVGVASPIIEMVRLHPYEYTHFNRLAGGVRGAEDRYMLDYWGLAFKQGGEALRAALAAHGETPPSARKWKIAVCGPHPPAAVALGPEFELTWDPKGGDFALMSGEFYCRDLDAPVLATISREGVIYARAYDLRGHPVTELFTLPTP